VVNLTPAGKRVYQLIKAVREISTILPGEKLPLPAEKPATYVGAIEEGDLQIDYCQMHVFRLCDGLLVILEAPSLNRSLGKYLF
jgi:hypothetical protein